MTINELAPYPVYRLSGIDWLGDVPNHWVVQRADRRFSVVKQSVNPDEISRQQVVHYSIPYVQQTGTGVIEAGNSIDSSKTLVNRILLLVSKLNPRKGTIGLAVPDPDLTTLASSEFVAMEPNGCLVEFARYLYLSEHVRLELSSRVDSATKSHQRCSPEDISKLPLPWPPLPEQTGIVRFLDHTDGCIQRYIQAKQKLLQLLEEQKQATINQAITGNINVRTGKPYPVYKPSGVGWPGDVPEHWEVRRLKTLCSMKSGDGITAESIESDGKYPVYGGNGLRGFTSKYTHCGDFALIGRQGALCGNVHIARGQFYASEHAVVATLNPGYVLEWFVSVLGEMDLNRYSIAAAQPGLAVERILNLSLPVPPSGEQAIIATFIERQSGHIDNSISKMRRQIDLMQEYRTRLIADVVTGKVDVRGIVDELPDTDSITDPDVDGTVHDGPGTRGENQRHMRTQDPVKELPT